MNNELANVTFNDMMTQAETLRASGFLPKSISTAQQAVAIMTMGKELGIGMWAAFNGINVIQGKPTISPQLMLALINRSGELADMRVDDNGEACAVTMQRKGRTPHTETFSMADAGAMGLSGKDNWRKQGAVMRKWRATAACARVVFPDIVMGFYSPEEINPDADIDYETGEMVQQHVPVDVEIIQDGQQALPEPRQRAQTPQGVQTPTDGANGATNGLPQFPADDAWIPDLDGKSLYLLQNEGWKHAGVDNVVHFKNRWRKVYAPARSIQEIQATVGDFLTRMSQPSEPEFEPAGPDVGDGDNMPGTD